MKLLIDMHHADLFYSLQLLFEKRLGWEVYRPVGLDWYHQGYWNIYPHPDTATQFLGLHLGDSFEEIKKKYPNTDLFIPLNQEAKETSNGIYIIPDVTKDHISHRGITLEAFKSIKFDILVSSVPQHISIYNRLIQLYQPQAKHIFQVGNAWGHQPGVKNILASTSPFSCPSDINIVFYHQEFDQDVFKYEPPNYHNIVNSYVHLMKLPELINLYKFNLPDWNFYTYGAGMDKSILKTKDIASCMKDSAFTWHYKPEGDGYGYSLHHSYSCGRPALIWGNQYQGKLASDLFQHGVTCIDMNLGDQVHNLSQLKYFAQPEEHNKMCEAAHNKFKQVVSFDEEFLNIKKFLDRLI